MAAAREILSIIPTLQAAALLSHNARALKKKKKNLTRLGIENIAGTGLIKANADFIAGVD